MWLLFFLSHPPFNRLRNEKKPTFISEVSRCSCYPNSLGPHLLMTNEPCTLRDPCQSHRFLSGSLASHVFIESPYESRFFFTLPILPATTHFRRRFIKSDAQHAISKSTYSPACTYFLWNSLRSKLSRCLFLLQFTTASNSYWVVKSHTVTAVARLFKDNFTA